MYEQLVCFLTQMSATKSVNPRSLPDHHGIPDLMGRLRPFQYNHTHPYSTYLSRVHGVPAVCSLPSAGCALWVQWAGVASALGTPLPQPPQDAARGVRHCALPWGRSRTGGEAGWSLNSSLTTHRPADGPVTIAHTHIRKVKGTASIKRS